MYSKRYVPFPLQTKVQTEIECMQALGVIYPINEPSPWWKRIVVVSKALMYI